ncbi:HepT-like ribonuclease domain-containing protein [Niabella ginsengisoli]|uniref:DUF86 domain-containing protein n=1 Tax=Niabella ginsengisoli TaxID=522298 RepID=A0ABS9SNV8_9BACT|nr:DUF86 domain-containing protein [Niabella ginsengisoli]MCH5600098.1 DUF86 domain-containing protein [Niabella ginsengisoli]
MSERNLELWLLDMQEAINHILSFTSQLNFDQFSSNLQVKHAVLHNFAIIGEASSKVPDSFKNAHSEISWREIKGFRNYVIHEYFGLDDSIVWDIIQSDLPDLQKKMVELLMEE